MFLSIPTHLPRSGARRALRPWRKTRKEKTCPISTAKSVCAGLRDNLYFLFICPYDELYLKPAPTTRQETNELWNWDVAEVFISANFRDIKLYKEFEVSPQGEWVDLDIDLHKPHHEDGMDLELRV